MENYSKAEAMAQIREAIRGGANFVNQNPKDYYISRIFTEIFTESEAGQWRRNDYDSVSLMQSLRRNMRPTARAAEAERQKQAADEFQKLQTSCNSRGISWEHYMSN